MAGERITVAVVDGGGRGSSLVEAYSLSPHVDRLLAIPGNDWIKHRTISKPVKTYPKIKTTNVERIVDICQAEKVTLVDIAQDNAIAAGLANGLAGAKILAVGPTQQAGRIESEKSFTRNLLSALEIAQPKYKICYSAKDGRDYLLSQPDQEYFIKANGLAGGLGALAARDRAEALLRIAQMRKFGRAGRVFLIEEWLKNDDGTKGDEISIYAVGDKIIASAQDYKRALEGDEGENTGSMGCSSNPSIFTADIYSQAQVIYKKVHHALAELGSKYRGVLYLGGMIVQRSGRPILHVLEFNARWGDPEAQAIVPSLKTDFFELWMAIAQDRVQDLKIESDNLTRLVVVLASRGYPNRQSALYKASQGKEIFGIDQAKSVPNLRVFGAGVQIKNNRYFTHEGRVLNLVGEGINIVEARRVAYQAKALIKAEDDSLYGRGDIGWREVERHYRSIPTTIHLGGGIA